MSTGDRLTPRNLSFEHQLGVGLPVARRRNSGPQRRNSLAHKLLPELILNRPGDQLIAPPFDRTVRALHVLIGRPALFPLRCSSAAR